MQELINNAKKEFENILAHVAREISTLHVSRATPALVEDIVISVYGQKMPLNQVASLSAPDARTIIVQPWDTSILAEVQRGIAESHIGFSSSVEEKFVRLTMPQLSEERRREIIKHLGKKIEEARISIRRVRDHVQKSVEESERAKEISEDQKFRSKDALQKLVDEYNRKIADIEDKKIRDIEGN
ncbi:MAG: ribosome-recycling factor [Patescibacteria group bacterium]